MWERAGRGLRERLGEVDSRFTGGPGDGERLAREWAREHHGGPVVVVGGDGSVHEVLNGILSAGSGCLLGIIPAGTGNDIARNLGPPNPQVGPGSELAPGCRRLVDVGRAEFRTPSGELVNRFFLNSLSTGVSALANRIALRMRRILPGTARYPLAGLGALLRSGPARYEVRDGEKVLHRGPALNITIANGACFGGGLRISPGSDPADGVLDLVVIGPINRFRAATALARLRSGGHIGMKGVRAGQVRGPVVIRRDDSDRTPILMIETDGENLDAAGRGEVRVELRAGGLEVVGIGARD